MLLQNISSSKKHNQNNKQKMKHIKKFLRYISAVFHIRDQDVCEFSKNRYGRDYHDYVDDRHGVPWHFHEMTCKRCGKKFYI